MIITVSILVLAIAIFVYASATGAAGKPGNAEGHKTLYTDSILGYTAGSQAISVGDANTDTNIVGNLNVAELYSRLQ